MARRKGAQFFARRPASAIDGESFELMFRERVAHHGRIGSEHIVHVGLVAGDLRGDAGQIDVGASEDRVSLAADIAHDILDTPLGE